MIRRRFRPRTIEAYLGWMLRYWKFHDRRDPAELGAEHVTEFLNHLPRRIRNGVTTSIRRCCRGPCGKPFATRASPSARAVIHSVTHLRHTFSRTASIHS